MKCLALECSVAVTLVTLFSPQNLSSAPLLSVQSTLAPPGTVVSVAVHYTTDIRTNGSAMHLKLSGTSGRSYVISAATNLGLAVPGWIHLTTNVAPAGILNFEDTSAGAFTSRFYRAFVAR